MTKVSRVPKFLIAPVLTCLLLSSSTLAPLFLAPFGPSIFWAGQSAMAQAGGSANSKALVTLETKFFEHTYPADSDDDRVARLEKLIFGESKSGDLASRLSDIQKIVTTNDATSTNASTNASSASSSTASSSGSSGSGSSSSGSSSSGTNTASSSVPLGSYPRVDALEELLLSTTNKKMALEKRLGLLEKKAFGHPSNSDDMSARTDALEQYWQKNLSPSQNQKYDTALTQLEGQVIGQSYPDKPIIERLQTLEGIVFPNEPPDTHASIKEQLETLANAVQISAKQGKRPTASAAAGGTPASQSGGQGNYGSYSDNSQTASGAPGQYGSYGQTTPYANSPTATAGNYGTQAGYANTDHSGYAGQPAANNYTSQGQYAPPQQAQAQTPPANYGQITPFANSPTQNEQYGGQTNNQNTAEQKQNNGHPLLKGLAKALGTAAGMAAGSVGRGMMYNSMGGYGGYGGYGGGYGGYGGGYGGMGGYGSPYGYGGMGGMGGLGGMGGMGGYGSSMGRWW